MKGNSNASKISQIIKEIGLINVSTSRDNSDEFLINHKLIDNSVNVYYNDLFNKFKIHFDIQLSGKCDLLLLKKYIDEAKEYKKEVYALNRKFKDDSIESKRKNDLVRAENIGMVRSKLIKIDTIFSNIISIIEDERDYFDYRTSSTDSKENFKTLINAKSNQVINDFGRATFNLSKKESLMFLHILEEVNLLKFENNTQRKSFIEQNFNFTEVRNNEFFGKPFPMTGIQSEYSKFNSNDKNELMSNNKTLEYLSKKLTNIIEEFEFTKKTKN